MAKWAIIENETIVNTIEAEEDFIAANYPNAVLCTGAFGIGDNYKDGSFISNQVSVEVVEEETPTPALEG